MKIFKNWNLRNAEPFDDFVCGASAANHCYNHNNRRGGQNESPGLRRRVTNRKRESHRSTQAREDHQVLHLHVDFVLVRARQVNYERQRVYVEYSRNNNRNLEANKIF